MYTGLNSSMLPISRLSIICFLLDGILILGAFAQSWEEVEADQIRKLSQGAQSKRSLSVFPKDKTVIDMSVRELLHYYPSELRRLEFSPSQDELNGLLEKIGARLQSFLENFSNTSSKEFVFLEKPGIRGAGISRSFNYMILYRPNRAEALLEEYRTDNENRPVDQSAIRGFFVTSGYVGLSLNFHPEYQPACQFRYLGRQTSDPGAYLVAFAQRPETRNLQIQYTDAVTGKSTHVPVQGIAWVDPKTYQILRLRINLLGSGNHSFMTEQSTDIKFGEVRFAETRKNLWLPHEVIVDTQISGLVFRNQHRYAEYKLFNVQSDFKIENPKIHH